MRQNEQKTDLKKSQIFPIWGQFGRFEAKSDIPAVNDWRRASSDTVVLVNTRARRVFYSQIVIFLFKLANSKL